MFLNICTQPEPLEVMIVINLIIKLLQVGVPIIIIIFSSIDVIKAVTSNKEEDITKNLKTIPRRLVAIVVIFLVPVFIRFVMSVVDDTFKYEECFTNGNIEYVSNAFAAKAEASVLLLEQNKDKSSLATANSNILKVRDPELKASLSERINVVAEEIKENEKNSSNASNPPINSQTSSGNYIYYNQADPAWASKSYCGCGTMQSSACGPTALAIVAANLGTNVDPLDVANMICAIGGRVCGSGTKWSALYDQSIMSKLNLNATIPTSSQNSSVTNQKQAILQAVSEGKFAIMSIPGHFVVIAAGDNGKIYVLDPGSRNATKTYSIDDYYDEIYNHKNRCTTDNNCGWNILAFYSKG